MTERRWRNCVVPVSFEALINARLGGERMNRRDFQFEELFAWFRGRSRRVEFTRP